MFPRFFYRGIFSEQVHDGMVRRNDACMEGFFSALGPTKPEEPQHARAWHRTALYRIAPQCDARGAPSRAQPGGGCGGGGPLPESEPHCALAERVDQAEGCTQAGGSTDRASA